MIAALAPALTTVIITTGVLLMLGIGILIARNGKPFPKRTKRSKGIEDKADRDARLDGPLNLPPAREELTEPEPVPAGVEGVRIGRRPMPVRQTPTDLAAAYEPLAEQLVDSIDSWSRTVSAELAIAQAQRREAAPTWGEYRPRHRRESGAITQAFEAITARLVADDETTTEIAVRAA